MHVGMHAYSKNAVQATICQLALYEPTLKYNFRLYSIPSQFALVTYALGGVHTYSSKDIFAAHAPLIRERGMNLRHFERVSEIFLDTLLLASVPEVCSTMLSAEHAQ